MSNDRRRFLQGVSLAAGWMTATGPAAEKPSLQIVAPTPWRVFQREDFDPKRAHPHALPKPTLGSALVPLAWRYDGPHQPLRWECRTTLGANAYGSASPSSPVVDVAAAGEPGGYSGKIRLPAGGWYRLELVGVANDRVVCQAGVEPVGVGEVFLIAGQSYAEGHNDERLRVNEPQGRVAAFDLRKQAWRVAHDPPPNRADGGTIWPPMGDILVPLLAAPVGWANVAVGATSSAQWLPGGSLFADLTAAGQAITNCRAILWQQGESDVLLQTSTNTYIENLVRLQKAFQDATKISAPWLLAKSTFHPTVYNDPVAEDRIRQAVDQLCQRPGFRPGPDTDRLAGENRGGIGTRRHFTGLGQQRAAHLWFAAIWSQLLTG